MRSGAYEALLDDMMSVPGVRGALVVAVRDGLVDLSYSVHGYTPGRYTLSKIAEFPFLGDSAIATSVAYQRIYQKHLAKFDEHRGMKVITVFTHGPGNIFKLYECVYCCVQWQII